MQNLTVLKITQFFFFKYKSSLIQIFMYKFLLYMGEGIRGFGVRCGVVI